MHTLPTPISLQPAGGPLPVAARQEQTAAVHVITQTIRRPTTTFVTYVTLGEGEPTPTPDDGRSETPPAASPTVAPPPPSRGSGSLSSAQIGAILGGIVAFVAIVLIAWYCMTVNQRVRRPPSSYGYIYDDETTTSYTESYVKPPPQAYGRPGRRPYQQPPPPQQRPQPTFHINQYDAFKPKFNGPFRSERPPQPQWRNAAFNGPRRTERPQQPRWFWNGRH